MANKEKIDLSNVKTKDIIHDLQEIEKEFENESLINPMSYARSCQLYQFKYELQNELNKRQIKRCLMRGNAMTNKQKFKEILEDYAMCRISWGVIDNKPIPCNDVGLPCSECEINEGQPCSKARLEWLYKEADEELKEEKFRKELENYNMVMMPWGVDNENILCPCRHIDCSNCKFNKGKSCKHSRLEWLNARKANLYDAIYNKAIDDVLPLIKDIRGLCRDDVLKDLITKTEQLKVGGDNEN